MRKLNYFKGKVNTNRLSFAAFRKIARIGRDLLRLTNCSRLICWQIATIGIQKVSAATWPGLLVKPVNGLAKLS